MAATFLFGDLDNELLIIGDCEFFQSKHGSFSGFAVYDSHIVLGTFAAMLALFTGQAMAQRCLPGMSAVEIKANMVDGFYTGNSRNCGYSFGVYYSVLSA